MKTKIKGKKVIHCQEIEQYTSNFGLDVETKDAYPPTHTLREHEKVYCSHNEALWGEHTELPT